MYCLTVSVGQKLEWPQQGSLFRVLQGWNHGVDWPAFLTGESRQHLLLAHSCSWPVQFLVVEVHCLADFQSGPVRVPSNCPHSCAFLKVPVGMVGQGALILQSSDISCPLLRVHGFSYVEPTQIIRDNFVIWKVHSFNYISQSLFLPYNRYSRLLGLGHRPPWVSFVPTMPATLLTSTSHAVPSSEIFCGRITLFLWNRGYIFLLRSLLYQLPQHMPLSVSSDVSSEPAGPLFMSHSPTLCLGADGFCL